MEKQSKDGVLLAQKLADSDDPAAIDGLIRLMEDADQDVRNWATFFLGTQRNEDSPEIRDALRRRLNDPFPDARQEAHWGLARRRDPEGIRLLLAQLESDTWAAGDEDTAAELLGHSSIDPDVDQLCEGLRTLLGSLEA